jgi:hypothetical protein
MKKTFIISGKVLKFPEKGGWFYIDMPKKYTKELNKRRISWGMYPIKAQIGSTSWKTKLMMKKGGNFFVALKKTIRKKEKITLGKEIKIDVSIL